MLAATAGFINSTGGIDGDNPTEMSRSDIQGVITALVNANAKRIELVVLYKPTLIDMESLEANMGQALAA